MKLHELKPAKGSRRVPKRVGRGIAAGQGKTSGRGQKGQGSRSSVGLPRGFEGGQLPLAQRLPKLRGFHNRWRVEYTPVNLGKLSRFDRDAVVDVAALAEAGIVDGSGARVKVLAAGTLSKPLRLRVHRISAAARTAVEAAGGSVELLDAPAPDAAAPSTPSRGQAKRDQAKRDQAQRDEVQGDDPERDQREESQPEEPAE